MTTAEQVHKINLLLEEYGELHDSGTPVITYHGWSLQWGPTWVMSGITPLPMGRVLYWLKRWGADVSEFSEFFEE